MRSTDSAWEWWFANDLSALVVRSDLSWLAHNFCLIEIPPNVPQYSVDLIAIFEDSVDACRRIFPCLRVEMN